MIWVCREARRPGSSPLARGLLTVADSTGSPARIIPARAGFTATGSRRLPTRPDHPRSRGVYSASISRSLACTGSSPLARGLPRPDWEGGEATRIIPARAGFTRRRSQSRSRLLDHPRSRGVYQGSWRRRRSPRGSSPLARGLRTTVRASSSLVRIIPARAGFTVFGVHAHGPLRDHPRSRGVYPKRRSASASRSGSSPLARGLRPPRRENHCPFGIIPARAGFTAAPEGEPLPVRDHPRSRGVYSQGRKRARTKSGSSPLARGLRGQISAQPVDVGIIPARAGFTTTFRKQALAGEDHPRSRGVYPPPRPSWPW